MRIRPLAALGALALLAISALFLGEGLTNLGFWEPMELASADHALGVSTHVFGTHPPDELRVPRPNLDDLGRGELSADLMALGFRVFGVSELAPRIPLVAFGLLGALALGLLLARFADVRTAVYGVLLLVATPLYFVQARTLGSEIVTTGLVSISVATLSLAVMSPLMSQSRRGIAAALGMICCGLAVLDRGLLFGISVPTLAVGGGWLLCRADAEQRDRLGARLGLACIAVGAIAAIVAAGALTVAAPGRTSRLLGSIVLDTAVRHATFDAVFSQLGHALFPLSAVLPFALAIVLTPFPENAEATENFRGRSQLRAVLALTTIGAFAAHSFTAGRLGPLTFMASPALAGLTAMALRDLEERRAALPLLGLLTVAVLTVLLRDLDRLPEKLLTPFLPDVSGLHASAGASTRHWTPIAGAIFGASCLLGLLLPHGWVRNHYKLRGVCVMIGCLFSGGILRWTVYAPLAAQVSPREALTRYRSLAQSKELLGLLGVSSRSAAYAGSASDFVAARPVDAVGWLNASSARRYLAFRSDQLPQLNAAYRNAQRKRKNLPVVGTRSGHVLLGANTLPTGLANENPLEKVVLARRPMPQHPVGATIGGRVALLGWDLTDSQGRSLPGAVSNRRFRISVYYRVLKGPISGACTFLHIDHTPTRYAREDREFAKYPFGLWRTGDFIAERVQVELSPNFTAGQYSVFAGFGVLPCSDSRRLPVARGQHDGQNRVRLGRIAIE